MVPEISRQTVLVLLLATFVFAVPLFHLGVPLLLAHFGPRWGWNGDYPGPLNFLGAFPVLAGAVHSVRVGSGVAGEQTTGAY